MLNAACSVIGSEKCSIYELPRRVMHQSGVLVSIYEPVVEEAIFPSALVFPYLQPTQYVADQLIMFYLAVTTSSW
jgi:hypothetical protein